MSERSSMVRGRHIATAAPRDVLPRCDLQGFLVLFGKAASSES